LQQAIAKVRGHAGVSPFAWNSRGSLPRSNQLSRFGSAAGLCVCVCVDVMLCMAGKPNALMLQIRL